MKTRQTLGGLAAALSIVYMLFASQAGHAAPNVNAKVAVAAGTPVIVVFREDVSLDQFTPNYHADDRARANPEAWNYLDHGVAGAVQSFEARYGFRASHAYSAATRGFASRLTPDQINALRNDPMVDHVEEDLPMVASVQAMPWGIDSIDADVSSTRAGDGTGTVSNVNVYVIDTGIRHADLSVVRHVNFIADYKNYDCNGHGTHVAGTIAAKDNTSDVVGVMPGAPLTGVKVLGCSGSGSTSTVIKGVDWVTANAKKPAVANMSLGGSASLALDSAILKSVASGVFYAVAAGNNGADACNYSPARLGGTHDGVMSVAAVDNKNAEASFSNYGSCVDIWAPGVGILSTRLGGGTTSLSGTSMASPHVAGTAGLYLSTYGLATPALVETMLKSTAVYPGTVSKDSRVIQTDYAGAY